MQDPSTLARPGRGRARAGGRMGVQAHSGACRGAGVLARSGACRGPWPA